MNSLWTNHDASDVDWPHLGLLCANVTPAIGGQEALLTHREVETLFHEFGHLMHHCLSKAKIRSQAGTNVAWILVELPSQIFENWCWEREALDLFAKHVETGQSMPEELFSAMKRARTYRAANGQMRQLGFAALDLGLHSAVTASDHQRDGEHGVIDYAREILERYSPAQLPGEYAMVASFGHLFGDPTGYAAAYYSYKWAEVLDADAFSRFRQEGIFNRETGQAFRQTILARGDEDDPAELFRQFMGRDPDPAALLSRLGLEG